MSNMYWLFGNHNNILVRKQEHQGSLGLTPMNIITAINRTAPWSLYPDYTFSLDNDKIAIGDTYG
jgi:hypothetical protein